jgi:hypothetical protein
MTIRAWGPLFVLIALFGAGLTGVTLQNSKPNNQAEPTKTEQRNRPASKPITETASIPDDQEGKKKQAWYEIFFEKPTDALLVIFNGLLALYTWRLYRATAGLFTETAGLREAAAEQSRDMKASIAIAGIAANASKAAAEALPSIERSYIFLRIEHHSFQLRPIDTPHMKAPFIRSLSVRCNFINHGKTHAVVQAIRIGIKRLAGDLAGDAWSEQATVKLPVDVLGTGESFEKEGLLISDPEKLTEGDADLILGGTMFIYFFGHVAYQDVFGSDRETQFCWRLHRDRFEEWGGKAHNRRA